MTRDQPATRRSRLGPRLATIASILVLVFAMAVVGNEVLRGPADPLLPVRTRDVVLAIRPIKEGSRIEPDSVAVRTVPRDETNSMAFTDSSQVLGRVAAVDILEWQLLTPNLLVEE